MLFVQENEVLQSINRRELLSAKEDTNTGDAPGMHRDTGKYSREFDRN